MKIPGLGFIGKQVEKVIAKNGGAEKSALGIIGKAGNLVGKAVVGGYKVGANIADKSIGKLVDIADGRSLKELGKDIGKAAAKKVGKAGAYVAAEGGAQLNYASFIGQQLAGKAPLTSSLLGTNHPLTKFMKLTAPLKPSKDSLLGYKLTGVGKGLVIGGALMAGTKDAAVEFNQSRMGSNDGVVYNNSLQANGQGNTWQSMQHNYLDNAGATGDLGFALHTLYHSPYY